MIYGGGLLGLAVLALWLYCIFDVISTQEALVRNLPKMLWLVLVVILPAVGSISWLVLGRPAGAGFTPGETGYRRPEARSRPAPRPIGQRTRPSSSPRSRTGRPVFASGRRTSSGERTSSAVKRVTTRRANQR